MEHWREESRALEGNTDASVVGAEGDQQQNSDGRDEHSASGAVRTEQERAAVKQQLSEWRKRKDAEEGKQKVVQSLATYLVNRFTVINLLLCRIAVSAFSRKISI